HIRVGEFRRSATEGRVMGSWATWRRHPIVLCTLAGWLAGMLWWTGLMIAFGPSTVVTTERGFLEERPRSVASRAVYAPLVAIPWALVWVLVGVANAQFRGYWVPVAAAVGTVGGGAYSVATNYFDGWLVIFMTGGCLGGTLVGLVVGVLTRATWGWFRGWEDSL
ncbi:MAG: hypothetical protein J0I06_19650, partial [Planctomycetes bacterium]|nr:hypothetical protein [Planctomycetota bacterium]